MHFSEPVSALLKSVSITDSFESGASKLACFFKHTEEKWNPAHIISDLFSSKQSKLIEYCLYSFLHVTRSDIQLIYNATVFKNLHRLMFRFFFYHDALSDKELKIISDLKKNLPISKLHDITISKKVTKKWSKILSDGKNIDSNSRKQFAFLLRSESESLRARLDRLSETTDSYDMKSIAKLLPYLTAGEEYAKDIEDLSNTIEAGNPLGLPICSFELIMKEDGFKKWLKKIDLQSDLSIFSDIIKQQRQRLVPVKKIIAVCTLIRGISDFSEPLQWTKQALNCSTRDTFKIDAGNNITKISHIIQNCGIEIDGTILKGNFNNSSFTRLTGNDMLSFKIGAKNTEPTVRELVMRCMQNDMLINRLLGDPRVYNKPGIVELIAKSSRSLAVLQKIASTRELYTGQANTGVALALLKNPTNIPFTLLRTFINSRYVSLSEMRNLINNRYSIRHVIYGEIKKYIDRKR